MRASMPWFGVDRTLEQQLTGLEKLWPLVAGRSVLDVGAAEGLIAYECARRGAAMVYGVDNRPKAIEVANKGKPKCCEFAIRDANSYAPAGVFDVVLLLAVLHKLRDPSASLRRMLFACSDLCVVRLPHDDWPVLRDKRSFGVPHDIALQAAASGFELESVADGPIADGQPPEFVGYFRRVAR